MPGQRPWQAQLGPGNCRAERASSNPVPTWRHVGPMSARTTTRQRANVCWRGVEDVVVVVVVVVPPKRDLTPQVRCFVHISGRPIAAATARLGRGGPEAKATQSRYSASLNPH